MLAFYPLDHLKWEMNFVKSFDEIKGDLEKFGGKIYMVCTDSVESHKKFKEKQNFKVTLLSDAEKELIDKIGTKSDKGR